MTGRRTTVVVLTHDRRDDLLRTLGHLAGPPERPPVIVTGNASTDGTARAAGAGRARAPSGTARGGEDAVR